MKKVQHQKINIYNKNYPLFICFLLSITLASSAPVITFQHDQIQPGETILATITTSGEFTQKIEASQIKFFQGRKQVPLEKEILYYNSTHYLSIYTTQESNLTLQIENILYKESETLQSITLTKNITIEKDILTSKKSNETYTQILRVRPGFIFSTQAPELKLINMGSKTINLTFNKEKISINPLATHSLEFIPEAGLSFTKIPTYKDFTIPTIYLPVNKSVKPTFSPVKTDLKQNPKHLVAEIFTDTKYEKTIELLNFGEQNLTNLKATSSSEFINIADLQDMPPRGIQNLTLKIKIKTSGYFQETISVSYIQNETENILEVPISLFVLPKGTPKENFKIKEETCEEMSGQVCDIETTICSATITITKNHKLCCLGSCIPRKKEESSSNTKIIIGVLIFAALGLFGYYAYKKQKQAKSPRPKEALQETTEKFEKRLVGNTPKNTQGNITRS